MEQKNKKNVLGLRIIAFESSTTKSHKPEQDTCHWQSICYDLRFNISPTDICFKSGVLRVMEKDDESSLLQISQEFANL